MSYFEDFEENRIGDMYEDEWYAHENSKYSFQLLTDKWITRNGEELEIDEMKTRHLINVKNMIERICNKEKWNPFEYLIYINILKELIKRYELGGK